MLWRSLHVRAAQAMPALRRCMPQRASSQSYYALCRCGWEGTVPSSMWVGRTSRHARHALGAVPARTCHLSRGCDSFPHYPDAHSGEWYTSPLAIWHNIYFRNAARAVAECPYAVVACRYCGTGVERGSMKVEIFIRRAMSNACTLGMNSRAPVWACMQAHEDCVYARRPMACPRECGVSVARGELTEHVSP